MVRKLLTIALAIVALMVTGAAGAQAKVPFAGYLDVDGARVLRLYDDPPLARANRDGHCYWGVSNKYDYACTVDKSAGPNFGFSYPGKAGTVQVNGRVRDYSPNLYFNGQLPYCLPKWVEQGKAYHDSSVNNTYFCAYWK